MEKIPTSLKTIVRFLSIVILCALVLVIILIIAGGGFGRKDANLIFQGNQSVLLFAHRGSGAYFPENSFEGFDAAMADGFKAIETDIRLSADDSLVIFHDENCERLLGIDTPVYTLPTEDLRRRHILFNGMPSASTVMTVDDLFYRMKNRMVIYLDIKMHDMETAGKIADLIHKYGLESSTLVANSNMLFIAWLEYMHPDINTVLEGFTPGLEWMYTVIPKKMKPDYLASFAKEASTDHMGWIKSNGLEDRRIVYGVNNNNFRKVIHAGVQKIIMDYDSTLQEEIAKYR